MSYLAGSAVSDINVRFRLYSFVFIGLIAFGSILYWRANLLLSSEYVELPDHNKFVKSKTLSKGLKVETTSIETN